MSNTNKPEKKSVDWLVHIDEEHVDELVVVPVCSKFQANVPQWAGPCSMGDGEDDSAPSRFLGTMIWMAEEDGISGGSDETSNNNIGKGRPDSCKCTKPGSYECNRLHISEEKIRLRNELGKAAYEEWRFDEMGEEEASRSWSLPQQKEFELFVKTNPGLQGEGFFKSALELFEGRKSRQDLVSYYLNVYWPKRISVLTGSGHEVVDSSDDEDVGGTISVKVPSKRSRTQADDDGSKSLKPRFLTGRR